LGLISIKVLNTSNQPVSGAVVTLYISSLLGLGLGIWRNLGQGTTGLDGIYTFSYSGNCLFGTIAKASATYQGMAGQTNGWFWLNPVDCSAPLQTIILNTSATAGPAFEMVRLFVKQMKNGQMVRNWDMLNTVGSPQYAASHGNPQIPAYTPDQGGYNFQIEATLKSKLNHSVSVFFRTETCPRGQSPIQTPPCGQVVEGNPVTIDAGATVQLPVWQLKMWSSSIDEHCWVVDADTQEIYNVGVDYIDNNYLYYPDIGYRADDWFIPIDVAGALAGIPSWYWIPAGLILAGIAAEVVIQSRKK
jgi:hypothetical protein